VWLLRKEEASDVRETYCKKEEDFPALSSKFNTTVLSLISKTLVRIKFPKEKTFK
jgi:hypothetical protein